MAKTRQRSFAPLPLSDAFYAHLSHTARSVGLPVLGEEALGRAVGALSHAYTRERDALGPQSAAREAHAARAHFFLPRDLVKVLGPVGDLARLGRLPKGERLRVLDLGAGLGSTTLGLARGLARQGTGQRLEVVALEQDAGALAFFRALIGGLGKLGDEFAKVTLEARPADLTAGLPEGPFDVVLLGFVLNELFAGRPADERVAGQAQLLAELGARLAPGGVIVVLEPALKAVTRELMAVRDLVVASGRAPFVLAPCVRTGPCPMLAGERDWCHEELAFALPPQLARVARTAGLRFEGLSYAALVLGREPRAGTREGVVRVVSERLESKGKLELFGCGEAGLARFTLLDRERSEANRAFAEAARGQELEMGAPGERIGRETRVGRR